MFISDQALRFSPASLRCSRSLPVTVMASSVACGWTSALVEHHRVEPDGEPFTTLPTPDQTIVVMLKGEQDLASFKAGAWRHSAYRAGTVGLTQAGQTDRLRRRPRKGSKPFEKVNLYIPQRVFRDAAEHGRHAGHRRDDQSLTALAFQDPLIAQTAAALLRGMAAGQPEVYAEAAVHWLAVHLLSIHGGKGGFGQQGLPGMITDKRLARVIEYMSAHVADALTLQDLATEAGVSKFHFTRLFRMATGTTPYDFLVGLRMGAARDLLTTTDLKISAVAARCGFGGAAHFGTAFAKRFGLSPTAFRNGG